MVKLLKQLLFDTNMFGTSSILGKAKCNTIWKKWGDIGKELGYFADVGAIIENWDDGRV